MKKALLFLSFLPGMLFADEAAVPVQNNYMSTLLIIVLGIVFFYVILWRPEQKRRKTALKMRESIKEGDKVTAMGIIGTVARIQENSIIVKMYDGSKIEFLKGAITEVKSASEPEVKS